MLIETENDVTPAVLDAALVCHLGFVFEGQPFVIPTLHARVGDRLYVHGSSASRAMRVPALANLDTRLVRRSTW